MNNRLISSFLDVFKEALGIFHYINYYLKSTTKYLKQRIEFKHISVPQ